MGRKKGRRSAREETVSFNDIDKMRHMAIQDEYSLDVTIVGAGASGIGVALMLTRTFKLDRERILILERGDEVGESFRRWPKEMRFISPSFNSQGWTGSFDLNSVAYGSSPAYSLHGEHPSGEDYAHYLKQLATAGKLNIQTRAEVTAVRPSRLCGFDVDVAPAVMARADRSAKQVATTLRSRYVIWAAGEYQYSTTSASAFPGSEFCRHNSSISSWKTVSGDDFIVIGGYESGMDAAFNLASLGKRSTVLSSKAFWRRHTDDPSTGLSPYTEDRVRQALSTRTPPRLLAPLRVFKVEKDGGDGFITRARWEGFEKQPEHNYILRDGETMKEGMEVQISSPGPPLLCNGFAGSVALGAVKDLFDWNDNGETGCTSGSPVLNKYDESTRAPGLFLVGPSVSHESLSFCFIYKFRQRFGIVADAIARGLGHETEAAVEECRKMNMFLDDLSCCRAACGDIC